MGKDKDIVRAGEILQELFSHLNYEEGQTYVSFFSDWVNLVGIDLACHVTPLDIQRRVLVCEVDHPGWIQLFQIKKSRILHRIQRQHPSLEIRDVHFKLKATDEDLPKAKRNKKPHQYPASPQTGLASSAESKEAMQNIMPENRMPKRKVLEPKQPGPLELGSIQDSRLRTVLEKLGKHIRRRN
ncbi:MAG: DUF721 domain-containing protein [Spirochaetales bacterium]